MADLQRLDPLEIYTGLLFDDLESGPPELPEPGDATLRGLLDEILLDALAEPPCHVLFSGGRDSSLILAAALRVARRHGLPDPIPLTATFPDHPGTFEHEWQERVIAHVGAADWRRLELRDELDGLGEDATASLRSYGPFVPAHAFNTRLYARAAAAGTILTGGGGDEIFTPWFLRKVPVRVLWQELPLRRAVKWIPLYQLPAPLRRRVLTARIPVSIGTPWLRAEAEREFAARLTARPQPTSREASLRTLLSSRYRRVSTGLMETMCAEYGVRLVRPFWDPRLVLALGREEPRHGFNSRTEAFVALFSDLLPQDVLRRTTKAHFTETTWGARSRAFVEGWDGTGVDASLVDPDALRRTWTSPMPHGRSLGALHQAWLGTSAATPSPSP